MSSFSRSDEQAIQRVFQDHIKRHRGAVVGFGMVFDYYENHQSKILNAAGVDSKKVGKEELMEIWGKMNHHVWGNRGVLFHGGVDGKARFSYVASKDKEEEQGLQTQPKEEQVQNSRAKLPMTPERTEELARSLVEFVYAKGPQGVAVDDGRSHVFQLANSKDYALDTKFKYGHVMRSASGELKFGDKRIVRTAAEGGAVFISAEFLPDKGKKSKADAQEQESPAPKSKAQTKTSDPTTGVYSMQLPKTGVQFEHWGQQVVVKPEGRKLMVYILLNGEWIPFAAKV